MLPSLAMGELPPCFVDCREGVCEAVQRELATRGALPDLAGQAALDRPKLGLVQLEAPDDFNQGQKGIVSDHASVCSNKCSNPVRAATVALVSATVVARSRLT